jgi:hypothetical protein
MPADPGSSLLNKKKLGPGSALRHFVPQRARDTRRNGTHRSKIIKR